MIQVTWLGHATFEIRVDENVLILDPWIEGNPAFPKGFEIRKVDAIALSHSHSDHSGGVIPLAKKFPQAKLVAIYEAASWFEKKGVKNTIGINKGGSVDLGFVKLTMTHALHSCSIQDGDNLIYGGEPAGYIISFTNGKCMYFAGDTALFSDMSLIGEVYRPEVALLPIGDYYTMDPNQAAHAARMLRVKKVIPMHYGTFPALTGTPEQLREKLDRDSIEVWTLERGKSVQW